MFRYILKYRRGIIILKRRSKTFKIILCTALAFTITMMPNYLPITAANAVTEKPENTALEARQMENLGRGVVAVRSGSSVFISWRLLALDPSGIGFNIYRIAADGETVKLNDNILTDGTNYTDTAADLTKNNSYYVKPVINGIEQAASSSFTLNANSADEPCLTIPIHNGGPIHFVWPGDFDGDGEYDYLLDRNTTNPQTLEAYKQDGTFLWSVSLGPNSSNQNNISPGSATIDVGMWDGATVYDLDGDGKAEVVLKIANGVTFGDGTVWSDSSDNKQWLAVLDGMTGKLKSYCAIPDDYISVGPMACQLGIGYLNGTTPSVVAFMKNRNADKSFNAMVCAYHYNGLELKMDWKWLRGSQDCPDGHQMRIADVDGDGKDEICEIGFVLNHDGTLRYSLASQNVAHGDRFYIGKLDKNSSGLQGYGIQQDNTKGLLEYYYDASTGSMIWQHTTTPPAGDVGRGVIGDIDPRYPGYEVWSFSGIFNGPTNTQITAPEKRPYPAFNIWWDGDTLSEEFNDGKIEKWDYSTSSVSRLVSTWKYETAVRSDRGAPVFYGDILGDWREEVIMPSSDYSKLVIFTSPIATSTRIYTLAQNPLYRNCMSSKGYLESNLTDYYLGDAMTTPPAPNIVTVQGTAEQKNFTINSSYNISGLREGKTLKVRTDITNNKSSLESVTVIAALYDDKDKMVDTASDTKEIKIGKSKNSNLEIKIPSDITNYKVKVFVQNGTGLIETATLPLSNIDARP